MDKMEITNDFNEPGTSTLSNTQKQNRKSFSNFTNLSRVGPESI